MQTHCWICPSERTQWPKSAANIREGQCAIKYQIKGFIANTKDAVIWWLARDRKCKLIIAIKLKQRSLIISGDSCTKVNHINYISGYL